MVSVGVDGAAVNLGNFKGLKAFITKSQGYPGTDSTLEYWAWSWVLLIHCINHLLELGIGDLKDADPYVEEFNEQLQKIFKVYYYSSTMESAREEMALLSDDDFTTLGGLNQIRWAPSQHRALIKLDKNYTNLTKHIEHVAASTRHDRKAECEGILGFATSLKFLKMMMFMIDLHSILKVVSLCFQKEEILIIEVEPILQKAFTAIENLRGGKGLKMLHFADNFQETGTYKGVEINRTRHATRSKLQARLEQFAFQNRQDNAAANEALFNSYNFYPDFVIASLKERFKAITQGPLSEFKIFDYQLWPAQSSREFSVYGDVHINNLLLHFRHMYTTEQRHSALIEWLQFKTIAVSKVEKFKQEFVAGQGCNTEEEEEEELFSDNSDTEQENHPNIIPGMQPGVMSPAELVFEMFANREMLGLTNICILLNQMIVMSPSNEHTERQIKFLNNIKTVHRTGLSQSRLNNQFKIAGNSAPSKKFDPQVFVDHYIKKSIEACEKKQKIVLRCGQYPPNQHTNRRRPYPPNP